jgi:hypothetical protein
MTYDQLDRLRAVLKPVSHETLVLVIANLLEALGDEQAEAFIAPLERGKGKNV